MADRLMFNPTEAVRLMAEDLGVVSEVPAETLARIADELAKQSGFLSQNALTQLVSEFIADELQREAIFHAIQNLRPEGISEVLETLQKWRNSSPRNKERLSDNKYAALQERLPILIREYPALKRMGKANSLRTLLGNEVKGFVFICDVRPVYKDPEKDEIEGLIPLVTLKVVYERQNTDTEVVELLLSAKQLNGLISRGVEAEKKLDLLRNSVNGWLTGGLVPEEE